MLSSDLFSYLDSDNSSSNLEDSAVFLSDQPVQQQQLEPLSLFEDLIDVVDGDLISIPEPEITNCSLVQKVPFIKPKDSKKVIEINMASDQEEDLVNYLTGKSFHSEPPCLKLFRTTGVHRSGNPPPVEFQDPGLCMSKNAVNARELRQKKKEHIKNIEHSLEKLQSENNTLNTQNTKMKRSIKELSDEVSYLRSILANQSALAGLLQNIGNTPGVKFQSSILTDINTDKQNKTHKPTAAITGVVKRKSSKRKVIYTVKDANNLFDENTPEEVVPETKRSCYDHQYAAKPTSSMTTNSKSLLPLNGRSINEAADSVSICQEDSLQSNAGVCLHVSNGCVSLELCSMCNNQANSKRKDSVEEINEEIQNNNL